MRRIPVTLGERSYAIIVDRSYARLPGLLRRAGLSLPIWVVSHATLLERFGDELLRPLRRGGFEVQCIVVPESERAKSSAVVERVIQQLAREAAMRVPLLVAFGGGVVGDLTGFVAAIFRRGVPYVQLPTTLLAQVDSAIGGKVGVDLPFAKNLIGAFYQPRLVFNHVGLLRTLPLRQRRSGLAEVIKYGVIADPVLFAFLERHPRECVGGAPAAMRVMVERSCRIKARVVGQDERETTGVRTQLNFGHTLGHALEAATGYRRFTHGEAIAIGMACAARLGVLLGFMRVADHARLLRVLARTGLPTRATGVSLAAVKRALRYDKKFIRGAPRWVLPRRIGRTLVHETVPGRVMWHAIREHIAQRTG